MKSNLVKIFSTVMTVAILISLCACKGKTETNTTTESTTTQAASEENKSTSPIIEMDQLEDMDGGETANPNEDF